MIEAEFEDFSEMLIGALGVYNAKITPATIEIWFEALRDMSVREVSAGLSAHVRNPDSGQYPPKPADVIRLVRGASADVSTLAWMKVVGAMRRVGGYASVVFDDPTIHVAIGAMGGWVKLTGTEEGELPFREQEFRRIYGAAAGKGMEHQPVLCGRSEIECNAAGHHAHIQQPVMIGAPESCQRVLSSGVSAQTAALPGLERQLAGLLPQGVA